VGAACERSGIVRRANSCSAKDKGKAYKAREANRHAHREKLATRGGTIVVSTHHVPATEKSAITTAAQRADTMVV